MKKLKVKKSSDDGGSSSGFSLAQYGSVVFALGLLIAVVASFFSNQTEGTKLFLLVLFVLIGIIVGFLNVTSSESVPFLVAATCLVLLTGPFFTLVFGQGLITNEAVIKYVQNFFSYLIALLVPGAIVVSLKVLFVVAKDE